MNETNRADLQHQRRLWRQTTTNAHTPVEAQALIKLHLEETLPTSTALRRCNITESSGYLSVSLDQGFAVGVEMTIRLEPDYAGRITNPDDVTEQAMPGRVVVGINWSGTTRTVAEAVASVALYQELIAIGASIEAHFAHVRIVRRDVLEAK